MDCSTALDDEVQRMACRARELGQEALYVGVGLGVMAVQRVNVRRHDLTRRSPVAAQAEQRLSALAGSMEHRVVDALTPRLDVLEQRLDELQSRLDPLLDQAETKLPPPARDAVHQARDAARIVRHQLADLMRSAAATAQS